MENKISVIIPTYLRVESLKRCLGGIFSQSERPLEIIIVVRDSDKKTITYLKKIKNIKTLVVSEPGQIIALNTGLNEAKGEIIAFTDDDSVPEKDWLAKIKKSFLLGKTIGAVGGRDTVLNKEQLKEEVGLISLSGRVIGNHHLGFGNAREVDFLKGVNMAFRKEAIKNLFFETKLRGRGAQIFNDSDFCLKVKKKGWKIIYDPQITVKHFAEKREDVQRGDFDTNLLKELAYNETYSILKYLGVIRRSFYFSNSFFVGSRNLPGLFYLPFRIIQDKLAFKRFKYNLSGRFAALRDCIAL